MPVRITECHEAECDECGRGFGREEDETAHYQDRASLDRALASSDWTVTGVRVLCSECETSIACALVGHQWGDWDPFDAPGYRGRVRYCDPCGLPEYDPPIVPRENP